MEKSYPEESNLGHDCMFWQGIDESVSLGRVAMGCFFPKAELEGRLSCEGIVDDICLLLKDGRVPSRLTLEQILEIRSKAKRDIPPGLTY
jgi:hypothetical protein